jgi:ABC-2 type transport system ATP-binding protein
MSAVIQVKHLSKQFNDIKAVDDLSFSVEEAKVQGFLGQNGAGKSTTIRILLTLIRPNSGEIEILGMKLHKHRKEILRQIGAIIEKPDMYKYLSGIENLKMFATMSGVKLTQQQLMDQLAKVGLAERAFSKVKTYSQGMKQRLGIAIALAHDPKLVILDEPTNGLDPQGIADIRNLILHLSRDLKKTVFVSSHLLSEMELIADSMLIIDKGKKIAEGETAQLLSPEECNVELTTTNNDIAINYIQHSAWNTSFREVKEDAVLLQIQREQLPAFNRDLINNGVEIVSIRPVHTLEEYFLSLTRQ